MSLTYYVNHDNGDDANTGINPTDDPVGTGPKKHLQATIDYIMTTVISGGPLTQDCTINLAGTQEAPQNYGLDEEDENCDTEINLENFRIEGDGELIIQPGLWDNDAYEDGEYPYSVTPATEEGFDPRNEKYCTIPLVMMKNTRNITIRGVHISRDASSDTQYTAPGILSDINNKEINFHYCTISDFLYGIYSGKGSDLNLYNCYVKDSVIGAIVMDGGFLGLYGQNYIENAVQTGILAVNNANVTIRSWDACPLEYYTTRISTSETRRDYTAIKTMVNSTVYIGMIDYIGDYKKPLLVEILNEKDFSAPDYYGIVLESASLFAGTKYVSFVGKDDDGNTLNEGKATILEGQQVVGSDGSVTSE